jgi:hypothetical protein
MQNKVSKITVSVLLVATLIGSYLWYNRVDVQASSNTVGASIGLAADVIQKPTVITGRNYSYSTPAVTNPDPKSVKIANPSAGTTISVTTDSILPSRNKVLFTAFDVESSFSLGMPVTTTMGSMVGDKATVTSTALDMSFQPIAPKEGFNDLGGLDWLITYKSKPASNVLAFPFSSTGVSACLQPPLTSVEIAEGAIRPDYIVNSIAFYASGKAGDYSLMGGKNYRTGKIGHLYALEAIDAKGQRTWTAWNVVGGVFTLTTPAKFLDSAVYPVTLAPAGDTFGYTTKGASTASALENYITGGTFTCPSDGTGSSITAFINGDGTTQTYKYNLYIASNLANNGATNQGTYDGASSASGYTQNFINAPSLISGTDYIISAWANSATGTCTICSDAATGARRYRSQSYGAWPNPISWIGDVSNSKVSIYVTYTPAAGYSLTNTPTTKDFGVVTSSSTLYAKGAAPANPVVDANCTFTITNDGSTTEKISIKGTNFTGGTTTSLVSGAPGTNELRITAYPSGIDPASGVVLTTSDQTLVASLAGSATKLWDFKLELGTLQNESNQHTGNLTLTAAAP